MQKIQICIFGLFYSSSLKNGWSYLTLLNFFCKTFNGVPFNYKFFRLLPTCHNWFPKEYKKVNSIARFLEYVLKAFLLYYRCISCACTIYTYLYMCLDVCDQYTILCANTKKQSLFSHLLFFFSFLNQSIYTNVQVNLKKGQKQVV